MPHRCVRACLAEPEGSKTASVQTTKGCPWRGNPCIDSALHIGRIQRCQAAAVRPTSGLEAMRHARPFARLAMTMWTCVSATAAFERCAMCGAGDFDDTGPFCASGTSVSSRVRRPTRSFRTGLGRADLLAFHSRAFSLTHNSISVSLPTVVTDPENPAFDLEKFLTKLEQDSK